MSGPTKDTPLLIAPNSPSSTSLSLGVSARKRRAQLLIPITVVAGFSLVLVSVSTVNVIRTYQAFRTSVRKDFRLSELSGSIIHIDEVLTMSARMAVSTGDPNSRWENRYNDFVPQLDEAINETIELAPEFADSSEQVDEANLALVDMEVQAFELLAADRVPEAFDLLFGSEYEQQKQIYAEGIQQTLDGIKRSNQQQLSSYSRSLRQAATLAGLSVPMLLGSWGIVLWLIRNYIRDRNSSQNSLEQSRGELLHVNEQLEIQIQQRAHQEEAVRLESETLQQDVGTILNVVSAVEDGDLTVAAPVSDGVTGLVTDTLNRLIEELGSILAQVLSTANQVSQGADGLDALAKTVSDNTEKQASSVIQVLELTDRVESATSQSAQQVQNTNNLLQDMQQAIDTGESGINSLNEGIVVLQDGTERIVQQMKTLGEFVGLADQFVQEQSQIASLTQILAMNAELVASRAAEQKDPRQFLVVAREFEAIAEQVSDLAQQTNQGLSSLEKRTNQIHSVVSTIDGDVHNLGELVEQFTEGVEQSNTVFSSIRGAASQVSQAGESVSESNRDIVESAQITAQSMRDIAKLAEETALLSKQAREETEAMDGLSGQLLERVQFFKLPETSDPTQELILEASIVDEQPVTEPPSLEEPTAEEPAIEASFSKAPQTESSVQSDSLQELASDSNPAQEIDLTPEMAGSDHWMGLDAPASHHAESPELLAQNDQLSDDLCPPTVLDDVSSPLQTSPSIKTTS